MTNGSRFVSELISVFGPDHILNEITAEIQETTDNVAIAKKRLVAGKLVDERSLQDLLKLNSYLANLRLLYAKLEPAVVRYRNRPKQTPDIARFGSPYGKSFTQSTANGSQFQSMNSR